MITLHNINGISRLSGQDEQGNVFVEFEVDYLAEQQDGECTECDEIINMGWQCLDGGEEYCSSHIQFCDDNNLGACSDCERLVGKI